MIMHKTYDAFSGAHASLNIELNSGRNQFDTFCLTMIGVSSAKLAIVHTSTWIISGVSTTAASG